MPQSAASIAAACARSAGNRSACRRRRAPRRGPQPRAPRGAPDPRSWRRALSIASAAASLGVRESLLELRALGALHVIERERGDRDGRRAPAVHRSRRVAARSPAASLRVDTRATTRPSLHRGARPTRRRRAARPALEPIVLLSRSCVPSEPTDRKSRPSVHDRGRGSHDSRILRVERTLITGPIRRPVRVTSRTSRLKKSPPRSVAGTSAQEWATQSEEIVR